MKWASSLVAALATVGLAAGAPSAPPKDPSLVESVRRLEFVEMLSALVNDEPIGPGAGWFHPAQSRYGWKWLAERMPPDHDGGITREQFDGPKDLFDRLDRDGDGRLTADDFDWSEDAPYWRQQGTAGRLFRAGDADGDGKLSAEEWQALFKRAARGKEKLTADDLRLLLFPPREGGQADAPSQLTLLLGLFQSEIGSPAAGPSVGDAAPDFTLPTPDGREVSLHDLRGGRPAVLVFGSFT